jgi:hypothetical protein
MNLTCSPANEYLNAAGKFEGPALWLGGDLDYPVNNLGAKPFAVSFSVCVGIVARVWRISRRRANMTE